MNSKRDCTTCEKRTIVDWLYKIAHCDVGMDRADGYPYIGEDCEFYCRIPGSDDDLMTYNSCKNILKNGDNDGRL